LTHRLPEWRDAHGSSFPIDPADILRAASRSEEEIEHVARAAEQALFLSELDQLDLR
jgi:hypothetical protein